MKKILIILSILVFINFVVMAVSKVFANDTLMGNSAENSFLVTIK